MKRIAFGMTGNLPVRQATELVQEAESRDFESFWMHETYFQRDALSLLNVLAVTTNRIQLASGCLGLYARHPALLAMTMATLNETSGGRAILGLGSGAVNRLAQMGIPHHDVIARLQETIELVRQLVTSEEVSFQGNTLSARKIKLLIPPNPIPIYVGGWNPKMLSLTVQIADGYVGRPAETMLSLRRILDRLHILSQGSERKSKLDTASYILTYVADDRIAAEKAVANNPFFIYMIAVLDSQVIKESGFEPELQSRIAQAYWSGDLKEAGRLIPSAMIHALAAVGTRNDVFDYLQVISSIGIQLPILQPIVADRTSIREVINLGAAYALSTSL